MRGSTMRTVLVAALLSILSITSAYAGTPFLITCEAESPADEGGRFMLELDPDEPSGLMSYEEPGFRTFAIEWFEIGNSTLIRDTESGVLLFAFVSETLEGWVPFEAGSVIGASCQMGSFVTVAPVSN